ncbi:MAG: DNA-directed RNA polymerase subunit beta, partial [Planctomycetota bacterium]
MKDGKATGKVRRLRADEELRKILAPSDTIDREGRFKGDMVVARRDGDLTPLAAGDIEFVDISPKQIVGVSASLIPFLEHDDANRALMGSNMQRQAVPLIRVDPPLVATGMEKVVGGHSGMIIKAKRAGTVTQVDAQRIVIDNADEYVLRKFVGLNERTCQN